ncbi:glycosyltransferase [Kribbella italica]|uniref:UDP:flavonoid glycosyltransferase YjiC (YdhE family) n=1 Tax=Kribbella italica TaxID=1540520 RepID=A0A7W9JCT4_9ACTN|nr:glycosyltransferase [Kribbella italica]MBB5839600.1 UDP:flavonoid glycosyltransferase YjiC (YdhE family) [Kribbella italica]
MRVALVGMGSRGDAQPMAVLAAELMGRGHDVVLATSSDLAWMGPAFGVPTVDMEMSAREFLESEQGRRWLAAGDVASYVKWLIDHKHQIADQLHAALLELVDGMDVLVSGTATELEGVVIAESRGLQYVAVHHAPMRRNAAFPHLLVSTAVFSPEQNLATYDEVEKNSWPLFAPFVNDLRAKLGLPSTTETSSRRLARTGSLELQAFSRYVVPELADWDVRRPLTGFLTPTPEQRAVLHQAKDDGLLEWIAAGEAPVYFGFGSMPVLDAQAALALISKVSSSLGVRALVGAGWSDVAAGALEDGQVRVVAELDHEAVLPLCRAAVHHGGAGTTASSLRAGLPTVVCSIFADQPFWGAQLARLGVGTTLKFTELTELSLLDALEPVLTDAYRERARAIAERLLDESGAEQAAVAVEQATS